MPLYQIRCVECGKEDEIFLKLKEYQNLPVCKPCNAMMVRVITPINIAPDIQPYRSMVTGEMIDGRAKHKQHLKRHGLVEIGNEEPKPKGTARTEKDRYELRRTIHEMYDNRVKPGKADELPKDLIIV